MYCCSRSIGVWLSGVLKHSGQCMNSMGGRKAKVLDGGGREAAVLVLRKRGKRKDYILGRRGGRGTLH